MLAFMEFILFPTPDNAAYVAGSATGKIGISGDTQRAPALEKP